MAVIDDPHRVTVSSVAMRTNLASLVSFPTVLAELGVRRFILQAVVDYNDYSQQESLLDHAEMAGLLQQIEAACIAHGIELELSGPDRSHADLLDSMGARERFYGFGEWDERFTRLCHVPWEIPFVDKDGVVFACCFAASANERPLGRIGPETFDEVWTGAPFRQFRADIVDGRSTPGICRRCTVAPLGRHLFKTWVATVISGHVSAPARELRPFRSRCATTAIGRGPRPTACGSVAPGRATRSRRSRIPGGCHRTVPRPSPRRPCHRAQWRRSRFPIAAPRGVRTATFEILADGTCWMANTSFAITVAGRRRLVPLRPLLVALQQRRGRVSRTCKRAVPLSVRRRLAHLALNLSICVPTSRQRAGRARPDSVRHGSTHGTTRRRWPTAWPGCCTRRRRPQAGSPTGTVPTRGGVRCEPRSREHAQILSSLFVRPLLDQ